MKSKILVCITVVCLIAGWVVSRGSVSERDMDPGPVDFNRDIQPILSDNCFTCHGPDEKQRKEELRLDTRDGLLEDRGGYSVVEPGNSADSELFKRISSSYRTEVMPPPKSKRKLTPTQIELVRRWIDQGAQWQEHWSFVAPKRPRLPQVEDTDWPRNEIDHFVLARLERAGLQPSPEADKTTLIRRVTLDLTGLPPEVEEIDAFLADDSPNAYEIVVDRLLASPHYGERMALKWLDLARYADTHGYHIDSHRDMWHWRDWVIGAYNRNLPFDQFTIQQLAGDLLPAPSRDEKIASGFNRNHMINYEGGAIPEEYLNEYIVDRVNTTSTVWMGLTMSCARCHDHKYDPISQKEFYQFYAFFANIAEKGLDGSKGNAAPYLQVPTQQQQLKLDQLRSRITSVEKGLPESVLKPLQEQWEEEASTGLLETLREGIVAHYELDGHFADTSGFYQHGVTEDGSVTYRCGPIGEAVQLDGQTSVRLGSQSFLDPNAPFSLAFWARPTRKDPATLLSSTDGAAEWRGYGLFLDDPQPLPNVELGTRLLVRLAARWPHRTIEIRTSEMLQLGSWHHLTVTYDGSAKADGLKVYRDGKLQEVEILRDELSGELPVSGLLHIAKGQGEEPFSGSLDEFRLYDRELDWTEVEQLAVHHPAQTILALPAAQRSEDQVDRLSSHYLTWHAPSPYRERHLELTELEQRRKELNARIPTTMIMQETEEPVATYVLERGDYRNPKDQVKRGVPAVLPPLRKEEGEPNRLDLARWLLDPSHPLTSRVAVNRYWSMMFGRGVVGTPEDFGRQGEEPSHPLLLDWLAKEFERTGWDVKAMLRLIVTSATYRQCSNVSPDLLEKDPQNRLLARAPRIRLDAELVRDNALAISGLLSREIGGPSVFPYQPEGLWKEMAYGDRFTAQIYTPSKGSDLYRRGMYTFWKRTIPPPSLVNFDAPDRETCTVRRERTNTPLQALVLMNDPTYVEAAGAFATRILKAERNQDRRLLWGFRQATAREPTLAEKQVLVDILHKQLDFYRNDRPAARALINSITSVLSEVENTEEMAAWTGLASVILNLDETITRE